MANSLECRGPFLDHRVVELAMMMPVRRKLRLRGGRSKVVLKQAFADLLPPAIRSRPKMGFGVPLDRWFRGELEETAHDLLLGNDRGLFRRSELERLLREHAGGTADHGHRLWCLCMLELWQRTYVDAGRPQGFRAAA
jgi:asparagine synthase (glutamine-hydrolysing)